MRFQNCSAPETYTEGERTHSAGSMSAPAPTPSSDLPVFYFSSNKWLAEQSCCKPGGGRQGQVCSFLKYTFRAGGTETSCRRKP